MPTKHREAMQQECGGNLVLTAHPHRCLLLYPQPAWEPIQAKMMALSSFDPKSSALQRLLVGFAEDISLDSAGRLLVSPVLRDFASLDKEVMLVGQFLCNIRSAQDQIAVALFLTSLTIARSVNSGGFFF